MGKLALFFVVGLVVLAAVTFLFLGSGRRLEAVTVPEPASGEEAGGLPPTTAEARYAPEAEVGAPSTQEASTGRVSLEASVAPVPFVAGRLEIPSGAPPDETLVVHVHASARELGEYRYLPGGAADEEEITDYLDRRGSQPLMSVPVDADGSFSFSAQELGESVWLVVDGRFLYSSDPLELDVAAALADGDEILLRPLLGGAISGRLSGSAGNAPRGGVAALAHDVGRGLGGVSLMDLGDGNLALRCDEGGRFDFRGLPRGVRQVAGRAQGTALSVRRGIRVETAELTTVELTLARGGTIRGRALTGAEPLEGVSIWTRSTENGSGLLDPWGFLESRGRSADDGTYELRDVASWATIVKAITALASAEIELETGPAAGEVLEGVDLVFAELHWIAGRVVDTDGRPAPGAELQLGYEYRGQWRAIGGDSRTDSSGRFRLQCREKDTCRIDALVRDPQGRVRARGALADLAAGATDVVIELTETRDVPGNAQTASGAVPAGGWVRIDAARNETGWSAAAEIAPDGAFGLEGIPPGTWKVSAKFTGWRWSQTTVDVPRDGPVEPLAILFTTELAPGRAGVVVDPYGRPVAGALVADDENGGLVFEDRTSNVQVADAAGRFRSSADAKTHLAAWAPGFAASLPVLMGDSDEELELRLRRGGGVRGSVRTAQGRVAHDYFVRLMHAREMHFRMAATDESGRFEATDLAPGSWTATAFPVVGYGFHEWESELEKDFGVTKDRSVSGRFQVVAGETGEVTLGADPVRSVHVTGEVRQGDQPVQAKLVFVADGSHPRLHPPTVAADVEGRFELELPVPGAYTVLVASKVPGLPVHLAVEIPDRAEHRLSIRVPGAGVQGVVLGASGEAVEGASVVLQRRDGAGTGLRSTWLAGALKTDEAGAFRFPGIEPGPYTVRLASPIAAPVEVELRAAETAQVTLEIEKEGTLIARFLREDAELPNRFSAYVRGANGAWVFGQDLAATREDGLRLTVAPGTYSVFACASGAASLESQPVVVGAGQTAEVELVLEPASLLVVQVRGAENPGATRLWARDQEGRAWAGVLQTREDLGQTTRELFATEGLRPNAVYLGPLPNGVYRIEVSCEERRASVEVELDGKQPRREVEVELR